MRYRTNQNHSPELHSSEGTRNRALPIRLAILLAWLCKSSVSVLKILLAEEDVPIKLLHQTVSDSVWQRLSPVSILYIVYIGCGLHSIMKRSRMLAALCYGNDSENALLWPIVQCQLAIIFACAKFVQCTMYTLWCCKSQLKQPKESHSKESHSKESHVKKSKSFKTLTHVLSILFGDH